jgi:hypothetical protein
MKNLNCFIQCSTVVLFLVGCQSKSAVDYSQALDMNISLQQKILQNSSSNILTISLENTSAHMLFVPEASLMLEFTSYSGSVKKTFNLDLSGDEASQAQLRYERLGIKGKGEITRNIDLKKVIANSTDEDIVLPADDYAVNLVLKLKPGSGSQKNEELIRSNYLYLQVEG